MLSARIEYGGTYADTLILDDMLNEEEGGIQALPGMSGVGLPPLTTQWSEGAGDGGTFRDQRVPPRDVDIPLELRGVDRTDLVAQVNKLSIAVSGNFRLRLYDTETTESRWLGPCRRVGGQTFAIGVDTDGIYFARMVITIRAADPYWTRGEVEISRTGSAAEATTIAVDNPGTAPSYPVWELRGPMGDFRATNHRGESWRYNAYIPNGTTVYVDCERGTVRTQDGDSRYSNMAPSPRFFALEPGEHPVDIITDRSSAYFEDNREQGRKNYILNPKTTTTTGWSTPYGGSVSIDSGRIKLDGGASPGSPSARLTVTTDLAEGAAIVFKARVWREALTGHIYRCYVIPQGTGTSIVTDILPPEGDDEYIELEVPVTVDDSGDFEIAFSTRNGALHLPPKDMWFTNLYLGVAGDYFDGSTTDTASFNYVWLGTANNSVSQELPGEASLAETRALLRYYPRDWMVV